MSLILYSTYFHKKERTEAKVYVSDQHDPVPFCCYEPCCGLMYDSLAHTTVICTTFHNSFGYCKTPNHF